MNRLAIKAKFAASLLIPVYSARPQEKPSKEEPQAVRARLEGQQLRLQVVFTEFDGDKKVKSLPYTLLIRAGIPGAEREWARLRMGSKVPVFVGTNLASNQYVDVGTNIDCFAWQIGEGYYRVTLNLERSWAEGDAIARSDKSSNPAPSDKSEVPFSPPIIRQFKSESSVTVRDGQALETNFATDPVTGKVVRLEVTVSAVK